MQATVIAIVSTSLHPIFSKADIYQRRDTAAHTPGGVVNAAMTETVRPPPRHVVCLEASVTQVLTAARTAARPKGMNAVLETPIAILEHFAAITDIARLTAVNAVTMAVSAIQVYIV